MPAARADLRVASAYEELAYFALSSVVPPASATGAARAAMLVRVDDEALATTARTFDEDADALTFLAGDGLLVAQGLPRLFASADDLPALLRRAGRTPFERLVDLPAIDVRVHAAMARGDTRLSELLLCDMALASDAFATEGRAALEGITRDAVVELREAIEELSHIVPAVSTAAVVVCAALGVSGRVFVTDEGPLVHAGVTRLPHRAREAALLVLHEIAVDAANAPYATAERAAIDAVAECVRNTSFSADHARRVGRLSMRSLTPSADASALTERVVGFLRATSDR